MTHRIDLAAIRRKRGLRQEDAAKEVGVSLPTWVRAEQRGGPPEVMTKQWRRIVKWIDNCPATGSNEKGQA